MKKSEIVAPVVLTTPFAADGDKNIIPATNNPSSGDASQNLGFPPITGEDINAGGIPPTRQDFNGLGYMTSSHSFYNQNGSFYTFSPEVSAAIGGYPLVSERRRGQTAAINQRRQHRQFYHQSVGHRHQLGRSDSDGRFRQRRPRQAQTDSF